MTEPSRTPTVDLLVLDAIDHVWNRVRRRITGLSQAEYLWEPVPDCWTVRQVGDRVVVDWSGEDPDPAPVTTMAWRLYHLAADCFSNYFEEDLGAWPIATKRGEWTLEVNEALELLDAAWGAFRAGLGSLGEQGMWRRLGPSWGPNEADSWAGLVLHAMDELSHHGAEIALLRDLWAHAPNRQLRPPTGA
jgi:hypothetical protein